MTDHEEREDMIRTLKGVYLVQSKFKLTEEEDEMVRLGVKQVLANPMDDRHYVHGLYMVEPLEVHVREEVASLFATPVPIKSGKYQVQIVRRGAQVGDSSQVFLTTDAEGNRVTPSAPNAESVYRGFRVIKK